MPRFVEKQKKPMYYIDATGGGGVLRKYLYGDSQSKLQNVDHLYTCVLQKKKKKKKKKNTRSLYLTCMTKPTHFYTIFTEMMTHYYHFHQQNSPSSYHHRNKGSLIYLEQFQNHPIGIPNLMKMHLKKFEHPRTPCFRMYPPGATLVEVAPLSKQWVSNR